MAPPLPDSNGNINNETPTIMLFCLVGIPLGGAILSLGFWLLYHLIKPFCLTNDSENRGGNGNRYRLPPPPVGLVVSTGHPPGVTHMPDMPDNRVQ